MKEKIYCLPALKPADLKNGIFFASMIGMIAVLGASPTGFEIAGHLFDSSQIKAAVILLFALINWISETIPVAVTALIVIVIIPFSEILTFSEAIAGSFGNSIFAFFLGTLLLSSAFCQTNMGKIIAMGLSHVFGTKPRAVLFAVMLSGMFLAMWVTEVAAASIIFPIALSIVNSMESGKKRQQFGKAAMLGVAWGCAFGGVATPIATGANLISLNYLEQYCGIKISFLQWMSIGIPISVTFLVVGWLILGSIVKDNEKLQIEEEYIQFGPKEKKLLIVFAAAIGLWIFGGKIGIGNHHVALLAASLLFIPGIEILDWKKSIGQVSWDSILLICSGVLVGDLLYQCGLAEILADICFEPRLLDRGMIITGTYIVLTVSVLKIMFSSNTVTGVVLVPIMIMLAEKMQMDPWKLVAPCIFSSALSLIIITSSPVNVIPYSSKYFTAADMMRYGIPMTIASALIIGIWLWVFRI